MLQKHVLVYLIHRQFYHKKKKLTLNFPMPQKG